jgi:dienelactone hydrolase
MKIGNYKMSFLVIFLGTFFALIFSLVSFSKSAEIQSEELVKLETRPKVRQNFALIKPENPVASVILFAGGRGNIKLGSLGGKPHIGAMQRNFLIRTRRDFAKHGLMVAVIDVPSNLDTKQGFSTWVNDNKTPFRWSEEHTKDIKAVASYLKNRKNIPVWLVGTSMGTFSAAHGAITLQEENSGLVLTSTVTRSKKKWRIRKTHPNAVLDMDLENIKVATLIVSHENDGCEATPASDAPKLKAALKNSPKVKVLYFTGGKKPRSEPCQARSQHGFYGIEEQVVTAIADFIKSNSK